MPRSDASPWLGPFDVGRFFWLKLGITLLFVSAAFLATLSIQHFFPYPFLFLFFGAVMASAWYGGVAAGFVSVLLSITLVDYFFVPPVYSFAINATAESYFASFVLCALVASWVSASRKKSSEALQVARDELEMRVLERTQELEQSNRELKDRRDALLRAQADLIRLSRAMGMGELTVSIAHEVNQPLTAVVTHGHACLEWLSADPPNIEKARQTTERIIADGTRAGSVLARTRALFNNERAERGPQKLNHLIEEIVLFVRGEALSRDITIRTELAAHLPFVMADRVQLQQVVLNLIVNGMDALSNQPGRREIVIRTKDVTDAVAIEVEDSGVGLTPEVKEKIFQPFFTTKPNGIGLGLSISKSIIEAHGGTLSVKSREASGAVFRFTLPNNTERENA